MRLLPTLTLAAKKGSCRPLLQLVQPQVQLNHYNNLLRLCKVRLFPAGPAAIAEPSSQTTDTHNIRASTNTANANSPRYDFFNATDTNDEQPRDYYIGSATWYKMLR
jgi:hypothetical protein